VKRFYIGLAEPAGLTMEEHQERTIERYQALIEWVDETYIMPVLRGYDSQSYVAHCRAYASLLEPGAWVGVGSVCKRNGTPDAVEDVLLAIGAARPDLRLHGYGLKLTALRRPTVRQLLYSADSMAWSFHERQNGRDRDDPRAALRYVKAVDQMLTADPEPIQTQFL
jgi:hypothetical protein